MYTDYILFIYTILILCIFTFLFIKNIKTLNQLFGINIEKFFSNLSNIFSNIYI